jgi:hypothetical protein
VWYDYCKNNFLKYAADDDLVAKMREINSKPNQQLELTKNQYIENIKNLNPQEHADLLKEHWDNYTNTLKQHSHLPNANFPSYEEWKKNFPDEEVTRLYIKHKGPKAIDESYDVNQKSLELYNAQKDLDTMASEFGISSEEMNPFAKHSDIRKKWAQHVAEHHKSNIPLDEHENQKVTLFTGYPGAGKSRFIEPNAKSDEAVRMTDYGLLVDPDEYQKDLMGYANGSGSERTMIYANSIVKPEILKEALARGNDVVIPFIGGSIDAILNEVINHILKDLQVDIIFVPTEANLAHQRSLARAKSGGRLIAPYTTGNPKEAFDQAKQVIKNPDFDAPDLFTRKLLTKLGYTPAQIKKLPREEKENIHKKYAILVNFDVATS